jgi:two-component system sensor histidine kinase DegS
MFQIPVRSRRSTDASVTNQTGPRVRPRAPLIPPTDDHDESARLLKAAHSLIEEERNRIARDLHDGPVQRMYAATLSVDLAERLIRDGDSAGAIRALERIRRDLVEQSDALRQVLFNLRPPVLEREGLLPAVRHLCDRFEDETGLPAVVLARPYGKASDDVETVAYRVVQEAISNVGKHAHASGVTVWIEAADGLLQIAVTDDGEGFDAERAGEFLGKGRLGVASMRERAELAGGTLSIQSHPGVGTSVRVELPCDLPVSEPSADSGSPPLIRPSQG